MRLKDTSLYSSFLYSFWIFLVFLDIFFSLSPKATPPIEFQESDKFYHMLMYLVLGVLPFFIFKRIQNTILSIVFCWFLGILLEHIQYYIPNREFSLLDILANQLGILMALFIGAKASNW